MRWLTEEPQFLLESIAYKCTIGGQMKERQDFSYTLEKSIAYSSLALKD